MSVRSQAETARRIQPAWARKAIKRRLKVIRGLRHALAIRLPEVEGAIRREGLRREGEGLVAEVLPLADACRFLEREASRILAPRRPGRRGRPGWLGGTGLEVRREPIGVVLIIAAANYPLLLPGVQALQALAAGNAVLVKPGRGASEPMRLLARLLEEAGLPAGLFGVLPEDESSVRAALEEGIDKVFMTGSAVSGATVLHELAPHLVPAVMELSGSDAVFVCRSADLDLVTRSLLFGLRLNDSATCIAPRRVFVHQSLADELEKRVTEGIRAMPPVPLEPETRTRLDELLRLAADEGGRVMNWRPVDGTVTPVVVADADPGMRLLSEDLFAPVISLMAVSGMDEALKQAARCPYALGASVFGRAEEARSLARRVRAGVVTINDIIVPTADPRLPFGGRGRSGFGTTRGEEGLLEMTAPKAISERRGSWRPHLEVPHPGDPALFRAWIGLAHGPTLRSRLGSLLRLAGEMTRRAPHRERHLEEAQV